MITVAVDLGNTRNKVSFFKDRELLSHIVLTDSEIEKLELEFNRLQPGCIILSSVVNINPLSELINRYKIKTVDLQYNTPLPIGLDYNTPETLGLDRIANAVAAEKLYPNKNVLIIDAGTCIKFDFISSDKIYRGGAISPGIEMRFKSMHTFTDRLPLIETIKPFNVCGKSTEEAMTSGVLNGVKHEMEGFINDFQALYPDLLVLLTGGSAKLLDKEFKNSIFAHPFLTAIGLNEILYFNIQA